LHFLYVRSLAFLYAHFAIGFLFFGGLRQDMRVFLAEKPFLGCAGLQVTDEMRVMVAAFACMPSRSCHL
jgi:hypothetical protein